MVAWHYLDYIFHRTLKKLYGSSSSNTFLTRGSQGSQATTPYSLPCPYLTRLWRKYGGSYTPLPITSTRWSLLGPENPFGPLEVLRASNLDFRFCPAHPFPGAEPAIPLAGATYIWSHEAFLYWPHGCFSPSPPPPPFF